MKNNKKILIVERGGKVKSSTISKKNKKESDFSYAKYLNLGFYLVIPLLLGVFLGTVMDNWLKTKPLFIILFIVLGAISSFYNLIKLTKDASH